MKCAACLYLTAIAALLGAGCSPSAENQGANHAEERAAATITAPALTWLAYRVRADAGAELNADTGWAAAQNSAADLLYDQPFRLRVQVVAEAADSQGHLLGLQYRVGTGDWLPIGVAHFPYPDFATPMISVIAVQAYAHGDETERLLGTPETVWDDGFGLNASAWTPVWRVLDEALEWEWPLVVRRFYDGPGFAEDGTQVQVRIVDGLGRAVAGQDPVSLSFAARPGHLGGTFVETPGRLGPYQSATGDLYFFIEPSETDNRFMAVVSSDGGFSWREQDGAGRPTADDLEGVASTRFGNVIHIIHQQSEEVFYHAFDMGPPARWLVNSESIATHGKPPTQYADLAARSDGSLVALYAGESRLFLQIRSSDGRWQAPAELDSEIGPVLSGPVLAAGPDDVISLAYTGRDGSGFVRHLLPDGSLSDRQLLSSQLGTRDIENGAIAPMVVIPDTGETVVIYRHDDGLLHERRLTRVGELTDPVQVSQFAVVTDAVDSEQVGADLVLHNDRLHLLFIEENSRAIYYTWRQVASTAAAPWSAPQVLVGNIDAGWVRGSVHVNQAGQPVYGFVYDAGSGGGSGFNTYMAIPLE
jgi:hypothetical protein